ncbi:hypothetical protein D3C78_1831360 [compost metagenome]
MEMPGIPGEALPQPLDMNVDSPVVSFVIHAPNLGDQLLPGENLPRVAGKHK